YSKISYQLQQNLQEETVQQEQNSKRNSTLTDDSVSGTGIVGASLGGLFDFQNPSSDYDEAYAEHLRNQARRKKRRRKGRSL
ncbi:MAG: hypothetical protein ACK5M7_03120, partial [Draconibacterium sp.]